jgi:CNT family concentrative nucleoside transporter
MLGTKIVLNEFVAYLMLADAVEAVTIEPKTIVMATFALCGFANFSSIAIQIGGIGPLAPARTSEIAELGLRAVLIGTLANLMTATIAGVLLGGGGGGGAGAPPGPPGAWSPAASRRYPGPAPPGWRR